MFGLMRESSLQVFLEFLQSFGRSHLRLFAVLNNKISVKYRQIIAKI